MSTPAIVVDAVSKRYRLYRDRNDSLKAAFTRGRRARYEEFWALRDVSFEVPTGSTFAIIGENGSGKSTMLKCLARILFPEEGRIAVTGKLSALLELGAGFHPELSGRENVYLNGSILGLSKRELDARFDDIVGFAGLEEFIDVPVKNYSSGMYVRLGFSVAINVEPDVLLVDEVLAVGDAEFQTRCLEKVDEMRQSGRTIVIVTHATGSVRHLCDRAVWLEHGKLRGEGTASEVIDDYIGAVHAEHAVGNNGANRWGSGEGRITDVEIFDGAGSKVDRVRTGEAVRFRFHFETTAAIERPVFGMAIHRLDGVEVTGPNTRETGEVPDTIDGAGHVDLVVDRFMVVPGTYDLSAALANFTLAHTYDHRYRFLRFDVEPGTPTAEFGVMTMGGRWDTSGAGSR